ncbi:hypothetical protein ACFQO9_11265 [Chryseobacterium zhengzhouense]|uniref:Uncharacterized protein n=1 Tax=Chryseobacterium zhengzhouense TaxID=1636086 RepID=A0ABW2LXH2_9FLAO
MAFNEFNKKIIMENTITNKEKFFAQYWRLPIMAKVVRGNKNKIITKNVICSIWTITEIFESYLELKPLTSITDDDAVIISKIENDKYTEDHLIRGRVLIRTFNEYSDCTHSLKNTNQLIEMIDYLRSKGYALPWMGISVEQLNKYGWIKIK